MTRQAKLTAIEAVPELAAAVRCFGEEARAALTELDIEIRRTTEWVQREQKAYWAEETRRGYRLVAEAQSVLDLALTTRKAGDHQPLCWEERKALEAAKRRLRLSQEKEEVVRHWSRTLDHELIEYRGVTGQLVQWLDCELPQAMAALARMSRALETYVALGGLEELEAAQRTLERASPGTGAPAEDATGRQEESPESGPAEEGDRCESGI